MRPATAVIVGSLCVLLSAAPANAGDMTLINFAKQGIEAQLKANGPDVEFKIVDGPKGKAVEVTCKPGANAWPGISVKPEGGFWDLSQYGKVEAEITNLLGDNLGVSIRIDDDGDWKTNPWNGENASVPPGKSAALRVTFGYSWGNAGYKINPAKITQVLIFMGKPKKEMKFRIDAVRATGKPGDKPAGSIEKIAPKVGIMIDFGPAFNKAGIECRGTETVLQGAGSKPSACITFPKNDTTKWPGTFFKAPEAAVWDLSSFNQVEFSLNNTGSKSARVFCRVDNKNADGQKHCVTSDATIEAGAKRTVIVPFVTDRIWDGKVKNSGLVFSSSDVIGVLVYTEQGGDGMKLNVESVIASAAKGPAIPKWVGSKPPVDGNWTKTFEDNFDGNKVDETRWTLPSRKGWSEDVFQLELEGMASWWDSVSVHASQNASVENGCLKLKCDKPKDLVVTDPKNKNRKYTSVVLTTCNRFTQKYGYFEARMKLPTTLGMWPAFWMMPDRGKEAGNFGKRQDTGNGGMEFDIMEYLVRFGAYRYNIAMHWDGYKQNHKSIGTEDIYFHPDADGFVTSGLLWEPGKLTFYCNGNIVGTWKDDRIASVPEYMMFTMPVGGWGTNGYVDDAKLPAHFLVDYVRVWQKAEWADMK